MTKFEFDPAKSRRNEEKHGVDFNWAQRLWEQECVVFPAKTISAEPRFLILARIDDSCYAAIYTLRGQNIRLISCHRADARLEKLYEKEIEARKHA